MRAESPFSDGWYWSHDGLRLHYRDYAGASDRPTILCLPGLTRNVRDFDRLAARLAPDWRVVTAEMRGRGESAYAKDSLTYTPVTYLQDIGKLFDAAELKQVIVIGTSLGGLLAMLLPAVQPGRIVGAVLNDIGPVIEEGGLARIRAAVGHGGPWPTWVHAARDLATRNPGIYPKWGLEDWLVFAHRVARVSSSGRIVFDYDPHIADPLRLPGGDAGHDIWLALDTLAALPVLSLRGALSDILSAATQKAMAARLPRLKTVTIANVGHAPTLDESASIKAIDALLAELAG